MSKEHKSNKPKATELVQDASLLLRKQAKAFSPLRASFVNPHSKLLSDRQVTEQEKRARTPLSDSEDNQELRFNDVKPMFDLEDMAQVYLTPLSSATPEIPESPLQGKCHEEEPRKKVRLSTISKLFFCRNITVFF